MKLAHAQVLETVQDARAGLPDGDPWRYSSRLPDQLAGPAFLAWPVDIARSATGRRPMLVSTVETWLITHKADPVAAEAHLDEMIPELVEIYESTPLLAWSTLTRGVLENRFHGWRCDVTLAHQILTTT